MPKSPICRDTIAQCDLYSNPYSTSIQANPALLRKHRAEHYARDSLESAQNRLEKRFLLKFKNQVQEPNGAIKIFFQVGKYTFFSVVFPLYFVGYSFPKWFVTKAIPSIYNFINRGFTPIKDQIASVAYRFITAFKSMVKAITSPILNFIQTRIEKTREIFSMVKKQILQAVHFMTAPVRLIQRFVIHPISQAYSDVKAKLKEVSERVQTVKAIIRKALIDFPYTMKNRCVELYQKIQERMQAFWQVIQKSFQPLDQWVAPTLSTIKDTFHHFIAENQKLVEKVLDYMVHRPVAQIRKVANRLKERVKEITEPLKKRVLHSMHSLLQPFEKGRQWVDRKMKRVHEIGKEVRERIKDRIDHISKAVVEAVTAILPEPVISFFIPFINAFSERQKSKKKGTFFKKRWKEKIRRMKEKIKEHCRHLLRWARESMARINQTVQQFQALLIKITKKLFYTLKQLMIFVISALTATFLLLRLMFAWFRALLRFGMQLVREISSQLLTSESS